MIYLTKRRARTSEVRTSIWPPAPC